MKYIGEFNDINEITYKVEIETPTEGEDETLLMSGEPVIISYESEDEQAYKPYKCSTATISFYLTEANFDLIDAFANRVKVTIYKENQVIWCGYATPNAYSQSYEDYFDTFELECQDGVSTLQYYDYEYIPTYYHYGTMNADHPYDNPNWDKALTEHNKANNFFHLVMQMNKKLGGMYKNIYVTDSIINPFTRNISILDSTYISENNFFDEDKKPMKMLEILEEICRYCSLTCVAYGENLYFISYDAIAEGINSYFCYTRVSDTKYTSSKVNISSKREIDINTFSSKGCKINVDSVYNFSRVKDDLYSVDSIMPSIDDESKWVEPIYTDTDQNNTSNAEVVYVQDDANKPHYGEVHIKYERDDKKHWCFMRYHGYNWTDNFDNRYIFYYYPADTQENRISSNTPLQLYDINVSGGEVPRPFSWVTTRGRNGACIVEYAIKDVDNWDDDYTVPTYNTAIMFHTNDISNWDLQGTGVPQISDWARYAKGDGYGGVQPMMKVLIQPHLMKDKDYIVISGSMAQWYYTERLPVDEGLTTKCEGKKISYTDGKGWLFQWCQLKCGDYYWNGSSWQTTAVDFLLPFDGIGQQAYNNFISIKNTISYAMNLDAEGYCVPCLPQRHGNTIEEGLINTIEFTMYRPHSFVYNSKKMSLLKDFEIKIVGQKDEVINDESENTVVESNREDLNSNVSEYDDINCKVCSWDNKAFNWSQTFYINCFKYNNTYKYYSGGFSFIDNDAIIGEGLSETLMTNLLSNTLLTQRNLIFKSVEYIYDAAKGYVLKPEELIVSHVVEQYDNPTLNLTLNQKIGDITPLTRFIYKTQFPKFIFAVDKITYNLRENEAEVKLINKKIDYEE